MMFQLGSRGSGKEHYMIVKTVRETIIKSVNEAIEIHGDDSVVYIDYFIPLQLKTLTEEENKRFLQIIDKLNTELIKQMEQKDYKYILDGEQFEFYKK